MGKAMADRCAEIRLRAERRAGEILSETVRKPEQGRPDKASHDVRLSDLDVSPMQSSRWQKLADVPAEAFESYLDAAKADDDLGRQVVHFAPGDPRPPPAASKIRNSARTW